ncbi:rCG35106 [Rattus norvegicus]|uniref:RCG35106 n=1 Tax=Rattus norvegicus TaxID=10116 RepID=A6HKD9_RAT|nr:rCG35106 [Rattus norvegicus]
MRATKSKRKGKKMTVSQSEDSACKVLPRNASICTQM